jgi:hypothetical protein
MVADVGVAFAIVPSTVVVDCAAALSAPPAIAATASAAAYARTRDDVIMDPSQATTVLRSWHLRLVYPSGVSYMLQSVAQIRGAR